MNQLFHQATSHEKSLLFSTYGQNANGPIVIPNVENQAVPQMKTGREKSSEKVCRSLCPEDS